MTVARQTAPAVAPAHPARRSAGLQLFQTISIAWRAIVGNTTRSILTTLGVIIGVAAVIALTSLGSGATGSISKQFEALGTNLLTVSSGQATNDQGPSIVRSTTQQTITMGDVKAIRGLEKVSGIAPTLQSSVQGKYDANNMAITVIGTWPDYEAVRNSRVERGTWFTGSDVQARRRVAVIGSQLRTDLFGNTDPLGKTFKAAGVTLTVVGVMPDKGNSGFSSPNSQVFVPLSTYQQRFGKDQSLSGEATVQSISVQTKSKDDLSTVQGQITDLLAQRHRKPAPDTYDFNVANQADALSSINQVTLILNLFLGGVAGISLLVGGIGIMNIMLVSVTERTREIGIRKALGARPSDILTQFLVEAFVLSVGGGMIGIVVGLLLAFLLGAALKIAPIIGVSSVLWSFAFAAAVGIFFGYYPAMRAARLDPVESLRYE